MEENYSGGPLLVSSEKDVEEIPEVIVKLTNGKIIHIEGGNFTRNIPVRCAECGKEWLERYETMEPVKNGAYACSRPAVRPGLPAGKPVKESFARKAAGGTDGAIEWPSKNKKAKRDGISFGLFY